MKRKRIAFAFAGISLLTMAEIHENPDYAASMTSIIHPTQVERTQDATRVSFHCKFIPGYWISVDTTACLVIPKTGERLAPIATEGIPLSEHFYMPESGEADFTVVYPSIPDSIREVDFIDGSWRIYGLRLDGSKVEDKTSIDLDKWENEHRKPYPGVPEKFFNPGEAIISGVINGYHPRSGVNNLLVYYNNPITCESIPYFVPISPDGTFSIAVPMVCPGYVSPAGFLDQWQYHYAEPGRTLEIALDWEDMLANSNDKRLYRIVRNPNIRYGGDVGEINAQLAGAPTPTSSNVQKWVADHTPSDAAKKISDIYEKDLDILECYIKEKNIEGHPAKLLRYNLMGNYICL